MGGGVPCQEQERQEQLAATLRFMGFVEARRAKASESEKARVCHVSVWAARSRAWGQNQPPASFSKTGTGPKAGSSRAGTPQRPRPWERVAPLPRLSRLSSRLPTTARSPQRRRRPGPPTTSTSREPPLGRRKMAGATKARRIHVMGIGSRVRLSLSSPLLLFFSSSFGISCSAEKTLSQFSPRSKTCCVTKSTEKKRRRACGWSAAAAARLAGSGSCEVLGGSD